MNSSWREQITRLRAAIVAQESLRSTLGDEIVDTALAALRERLTALERQLAPPQRKQVTILFADLVGFTPLAERLDPEDVHDLIDIYFRRVTAPILRQGGPWKSSSAMR